MIEKFGDMTINTGDMHDFIGMKIGINKDETKDETISLDMREQLKRQ